MIITDKKIKSKSLEAISSAKDCAYYRILPTGELQINSYFKSYVFLAYVRGNWFASFGNRKGASVEIPAEGLSLFAYGNNSLWIPNDDGAVEITNPLLPLETDTHVVLFAFSGSSYSVIIADGNKYNTVISTDMKKRPENMLLLILSMAAIIRPYDEKSADEIEQFWFQRDQAATSETCKQNGAGHMDSEEYDAEMAEKNEKVVIQW